HDRLVPELHELVRQHPLRENLQAVLMRALAAAGQRAQALDAYRRARRVLVDELGVEPGPGLRAVHRRILAGEPDPAPPGPVALSRSLLAGKRMLVVLDNARAAEQVRPLLPGTPDCLTLVTSRNQLSGLVAAEAAHLVNLDLLNVDDARDLLTRRIGRDRTTA